MKRINVIGTTGSGKSTLAMALAKQLDYPYIQMDQLFWKPNWNESSDDELFPKITKAIAGDVWVLDGNYNRTNQLKWERVDTVIWVNFGFFRTFFQLLKRTILRASIRQELWPNTGNIESFSKSFFSKESIILWFFRCYWKNRKRYSILMNSPEYVHINIIQLRNPNEVEAFLKNLSQ